MKKSILLFVVCLGGLLVSTACAEKVFYVKPTDMTECPSGDSPCHSLQYYANHSSFTNNSRFVFLEGEHHLDSVVTISNVANLSLVGTSSGVEILCMSLSSGFHIEEFFGVKMEKMVISYCCAGPRNVTVELVNGSEVTIDDVIISSSGDDSIGLVAEDVVGSFSIFNSVFMEPKGHAILMNYSLCKIPTLLNLTNITSINSPSIDCDGIQGLHLDCSNMQIIIKDFRINPCGFHIRLNNMLTSNVSVVISNFSNGPINITTFEENNLRQFSTCGDVEDHFDQNENGNGNTVLIENSRLVDYKNGPSLHIVSNKIKCGSDARPDVQMTLRNITFANHKPGSPLSIDSATVLLIDCTFQNNSNSGMYAASSEIIFQGTNIFRNNSDNTGGGMRLHESYMYLMPHTHIVFQNNRAIYKGGAIFISDVDQCFIEEVSPNFTDTVRVTFINNTAGSAGTSIY